MMNIEPTNQVPRDHVLFTTTPLGLGQIVQANAWAMASLFAYLLIPFAVAYVAFLPYDVR